jgi:acyl-CoA synthetase (AMP-forming)/AMP-acid ligase II
LRNNNITSHFFEAANQYPTRIALLSDYESITYQELLIKVESYCHQFNQHGLKSGDKVLVLHPLNTNLYAALLALLKLNCCLVFVEEWKTIDDISSCQNKINCNYIICSLKINLIRFFIPNLRSIKRLSLKLRICKNEFISNSDFKEEAIISFSSGSSGKSKAIIRTHDLLNAQFDALKNKIVLCEHTKMISNFPVVILLNLGLGISSYFSQSIRMSNLKKTNFLKLYQEISKNNISHLALSPYLINRLAVAINNDAKPPLSFFQIISGGSPFFPTFVENVNASFCYQNFTILYGSSEAEPIAHCEGNDIVKNRDEKGLYAGKIDEHCFCLIGEYKNGTISPCKDQKAGEIFVSGNHVVKNYYNSDQQAFENKISYQNLIWHRTGDFGYFDKEGNLYLTGDLNRRYKGDYLLELEKKLQEIPGVERGTIVNETAYIQMNENEKLITEQIKILLGHTIKIVFIQLPLDKRHNGKINYNEL